MISTSESILSIRDVRKTFRMGEVEVRVLRDIDLEVPRGRVTVVLGPSGSGKTTLLNIIGGIDRPDGGEVVFNGRDISRFTDRELTRFRRETVGFVFQFYNLIPTLTALENVMVSTELVREPMDSAEALELVGLADRMNHFPAQLSGGEQQRVAIARALAKDPAMLLCDEPTGALDLITGRKVLGVLKDVAARLDKTILIITHNTAIAETADRVVRLGSGVIASVLDNEQPVAAEEVTW